MKFIFKVKCWGRVSLCSPEWPLRWYIQTGLELKRACFCFLSVGNKAMFIYRQGLPLKPRMSWTIIKFTLLLLNLRQPFQSPKSWHYKFKPQQSSFSILQTNNLFSSYPISKSADKVNFSSLINFPQSKKIFTCLFWIVWLFNFTNTRGRLSLPGIIFYCLWDFVFPFFWDRASLCSIGRLQTQEIHLPLPQVLGLKAFLITELSGIF